MIITVFEKMVKTAEGRQFPTYFTKLTKVTGEEVSAKVIFCKEAPMPNHFPINLTVDKDYASLSEKKKSTGEREYIDRVLFIKGWTEGVPYRDSSLDDFI